MRVNLVSQKPVKRVFCSIISQRNMEIQNSEPSWHSLIYARVSFFFGPFWNIIFLPRKSAKTRLKKKNSRQTKNMSFFWGRNFELICKLGTLSPRLRCFPKLRIQIPGTATSPPKKPKQPTMTLFPKTFLPTSPLPYHPPDFPVPPASLPGFVPWRLRLLRVITRHEGDSEPRNLGNLPWPQLCWSNFVEEIFLFFGANEKVLTLIVGCFLSFFSEGEKKGFFSCHFSCHFPIFLRGQVIKWLFFQLYRCFLCVLDTLGYFRCFF